MEIEKPIYKVLIIDDDPMALSFAKGLLQNEYKLQTFHSNKNAKCFLNVAKDEELPDLMLLDVFLPDEDGFEMAKYLQGNPRFAKIPFIFQSGSYDPELQEKGFECGASDYILKPYNKTIVKVRITKAIEMSILQNNLKDEVERQTFLANATAEELIHKTAEIVDLLISTIEISDNYTKGHSSRVSTFSEALAKEIGYPMKKIPALRRAGLLHDIGKIGVSNTILNKNGKLSKQEYCTVKLHPESGYKILSNVDNFVIESDVAFHHHERWDGMGYPKGLKGEEISLESRIVAVADVFDVMKFGRIYQNPKTNKEIAQELRDVAGTQLDPYLAKVFAKMVENGDLDDCIQKKMWRDISIL